jgi:hypothetical protein
VNLATSTARASRTGPGWARNSGSPWLHVLLAGMHLSAGTPVRLSVHHAEGGEPIPLFKSAPSEIGRRKWSAAEESATPEHLGSRGGEE